MIPAGPLVVLVGASGAGKTTIGTLVAGRLGLRFRDTDTDVEGVAGKSVPDVFVQDGEEAFRALERDAVAAALQHHDGVLALGGGAVLDPATRERLRAHTVVFLDVDLHAAVHRVGLDTPRPLLVTNPRTALRTMLAERRPLYEEVATATVTTGDKTPEEAAEAVLAAVATAIDPVEPVERQDR